MEGCNHEVRDGDVIDVNGFQVHCLQTPGHTKGHVCYYIDTGDERAVFTGESQYNIGFICFEKLTVYVSLFANRRLFVCRRMRQILRRNRS